MSPEINPSLEIEHESVKDLVKRYINGDESVSAIEIQAAAQSVPRNLITRMLRTVAIEEELNKESSERTHRYLIICKIINPPEEEDFRAIKF